MPITLQAGLGMAAANPQSWLTRTDTIKTIFKDASPGLSVLIEEAIQTNVSAGVWGVTSGWTAGQLAACRAFQDSAGTIPVYAMEQPLGYIKDNSGRGNHLTQPSNTDSRPIVSRRVNLLNATDNYNSTAWIKVRASISPVAALAPDGTLTASKLVEDTTAAADHSLRGQIVAGVVGATYLQSVYLKAGERTSVQFYEVGGPGIFLVNLLNGVVTVIGGAPVVNTVDAGSGWWKISYTQVANNAAPVFIYFGLANPSLIYTGDGVSGVYMWHPSVTLVADSALPYQRVTSPSDYDEEGFSAYAMFDGVDDWLETGTIDMTGTDEVTAVASVMKLSDATAAVMMEFSDNSGTLAGTFAIFAPNSSDPRYALRTRGTSTSEATAPSIFPSPHKGVITGVGKISTDMSLLRVNGSQVTTNASDQGTGNYGNHKLYVGRRAGTSLSFKGRIYGLTVIGKLFNGSQLLALEAKHRTNGKVY